MEELQKKLYEALCQDMPKSRALLICDITIEALEYLQSKLQVSCDWLNEISKDEVKDIYAMLEADDGYKSIFRGRRQLVKSGFYHLEKLTKKSKAYLGDGISLPTKENFELYKRGNDSFKEKITFESKLDYYEFVNKVYSTLSLYPDVGLIAEQILDISQLEYYEPKAIEELLSNVDWCKKKGKRYYFIDVKSDEINDEAYLDSINRFSIKDSSIKLDEEVKKLMNDPEKLLQYIMEHKNV